MKFATYVKEKELLFDWNTGTGDLLLTKVEDYKVLMGWPTVTHAVTLGLHSGPLCRMVIGVPRLVLRKFNVALMPANDVARNGTVYIQLYSYVTAQLCVQYYLVFASGSASGVVNGYIMTKCSDNVTTYHLAWTGLNINASTSSDPVYNLIEMGFIIAKSSSEYMLVKPVVRVNDVEYEFPLDMDDIEVSIDDFIMPTLQATFYNLDCTNTSIVFVIKGVE